MYILKVINQLVALHCPQNKQTKMQTGRYNQAQILSLLIENSIFMAWFLPSKLHLAAQEVIHYTKNYLYFHYCFLELNEKTLHNKK